MVIFAGEITNMAIKNIIFDLGGVLLNLDFNKTTAAFTALGVKDFDNYFNQFHANPLFKKLETGIVADDGFYNTLRETASITADDNAINEAWNAMLIDFPAARINKLRELSKHYRLFLFSNTNSIHHAAFHMKFKKEYGFDLDDLFEKAYYSHLIGHRKPDVSAFQFVLEDSGLDPSETLFIDDTGSNLEAAAVTGMMVAHVEPGDDVVSVLEKVLK